ncbi:MAG TPA: hypothetical protein VF475_01780 [Sphingobium sp.]
MDEGMAEAPVRPTVLQTSGMLVAIIVGMVAYATLCSLAGVTMLHGGFIFLFYWAGIRAAASADFLPSLVGALGGTGLAYLVVTLPEQMGATGYAIIGVGVLACIFMMIRGHVPLLINNAFMLYLTVFTIAGAVTPNDFWQIPVSLLIAAGLAAILMAVGKILAARAASPQAVSQ